MALPKQRKTETMSVSEARQQFSQTLNRVFQEKERVIIEKNGIPIAAVVPISVFEGDEERERRRQEALAALRSAQTGFVGVPEEEIEREIAKAIEEVKRENKLARTIASALIRANLDVFTMDEESLAIQVKRVIQEEEARSGKVIGASPDTAS